MNAPKAFFTRALALAAALLCIGSGLPARAATPPSAAQYYRDALAIMQRQPMPPFLTFDTVLYLHNHPPTIDRYRLRTSDEIESTRELPHGRWELQRDTGIDPTWRGVDRLVRYGLYIAQAQNAQRASAKGKKPSEPHGIKTIVIATAVAPQDYRITDLGAATCPNGAPGHALHFEAIHNKKRRLLTHVVVESATGRFCEMRFSIADSLVAVGVSGYLALHFGESAGYWLIHDARFVMGFRSFGLQFSKITVGIAVRKVAAPASLPAVDFAPSPSPAPARGNR